jgi:hypothetical protein
MSACHQCTSKEFHEYTKKFLGIMPSFLITLYIPAYFILYPASDVVSQSLSSVYVPDDRIVS